MVINTLLLNFNSSTEIPEVIDMLLAYVMVLIYCSMSLKSSNQKPRHFEVLGVLIPRFNLLLTKLASLREMGALVSFIIYLSQERLRYQGKYFQG